MFVGVARFARWGRGTGCEECFCKRKLVKETSRRGLFYSPSSSLSLVMKSGLGDASFCTE